MKSETNYDAILVSSPRPQMVEVRAPATMHEGYTFSAVFDGVPFRVIVPAGGVVEGQMIQVPFNPEASGAPGIIGVWSDDVFACCRFGIFHPSFINACCCSLILAGQVMTRLKLDVWGNPGREWKKTFRNIVIIFVVCTVLNTMLLPMFPLNPIFQLISFAIGLFSIFIGYNVRTAVRSKYKIPETRCIGCEDFCCSLWCNCCSVSQMARQTANYSSEEGYFFTSNGLAPPCQRVVPVGTPVVIV
mmetsp:Transcript_15242/g.22324  ORF Transcript_15242/g.22324 Transcript_15242/m.22324 type:complete len:245 (+) Transcript_15242:33-767(+)